MSRPRRKLTALDDPLGAATETPTRGAAARVRRRDADAAADVQSLFVRIPSAHGDALARAAFELRLHKQEIVAALIARHIDPHTPHGLDAVRTLVEGYRDARG